MRSKPEARSLVKQALDILTPALQKRLHAGSDAKFPTWVKWTKKIIVEEGHSLPQLIHILQLIVRHPQLFYQCRGHFVPHMVNSLARIGLLPNSPHENRKLAVDLAELVCSWEIQRAEESTKGAADTITGSYGGTTSLSDAMDVEVPKTAAPEEATISIETDDKLAKGNSPQLQSPASSGEYKANPMISEMIVNFLIRIASTAIEAPEPNIHASLLPTRAVELLKQSLILWPDVTIKFAYFEKLLTPAADSPGTN